MFAIVVLHLVFKY